MEVSFRAVDPGGVGADEARLVAEGLEAVLGSVRAGELTCSPAMRSRIEGARLALLAIAPAGPANDRMPDGGEMITD